MTILFMGQVEMRFYKQMCVHPFAGWFSIGGVIIGNTRVSFALTKYLVKFVRDDCNSWAIFLFGVRVHVVKQ